jgi:uncharacterized membrane protein YbhN (UPF0104 family)
MSDRTKQILKLVAKLSVAAILLAWVFSQVSFEQFRETVQAARWHYLAGAWLATVLFSLLQAYALRVILRKQDCDVGLHTLFATTCVTAYYSLFLPGIMSTGVKWYILKRSTGKGVNVLSGMLYNQATLAVVMVVAGLVALALAVPTQGAARDGGQSSLLPVVCIGLAAFVIAASILVLNHRTGGPAIRLLMAALRPLPRVLREKGRALLEQIAVFQTAGWRFHALVALINVIDGLLVGLLLYFLAARAAFVVVPVGALIWLCAVVFVLGKIPITIANLGVREVTLVGLLGLYGVAKSAALLMSMVMFSGLIFLGLLGAIYQLYWSAKR